MSEFAQKLDLEEGAEAGPRLHVVETSSTEESRYTDEEYDVIESAIGGNDVSKIAESLSKTSSEVKTVLAGILGKMNVVKIHHVGNQSDGAILVESQGPIEHPHITAAVAKVHGAGSVQERKPYTSLGTYQQPEHTEDAAWDTNLGIDVVPRRGIKTQWIQRTLTEFQNRPLAMEDIAKILYGENYDEEKQYYHAQRINSLLHSGYTLRQQLRDQGLKIVRTNLPIPGRTVMRLICTAVDAEVPPVLESDTDRPSNTELRELAIRLRQEESDRQATLIAPEIKKAWEAREAEIRSRAKRSGRQLAGLFSSRETEEEQEAREATKQSRLEIREWREEEEAIWQQEQDAIRISRATILAQIEQSWSERETELREAAKEQRWLADIAIARWYQSQEIPTLHDIQDEIKMGEAAQRAFEREMESDERNWYVLTPEKMARYLSDTIGQYFTYDDLIPLAMNWRGIKKEGSARAFLSEMFLNKNVDQLLGEGVVLYSANYKINGSKRKRRVMVVLPEGEEPVWPERNDYEKTAPAEEPIAKPEAAEPQSMVQTIQSAVSPNRNEEPGEELQEANSDSELQSDEERKDTPDQQPALRQRPERLLANVAMTREFKRRPLEYDKHQVMMRITRDAIKDLQVRGVIKTKDDITGARFAVKNPQVLQELSGQGLISQPEQESGELSLRSFLAALLSKTSDGKLLTHEKTRAGALKVIEEELERHFKDGYLAEAF